MRPADVRDQVRAFLADPRAYLAAESWTPILALFALNAVDEFDSQVFNVLGPEIADEFGIDVGMFGAISLLTIVIAPLVAVPISYLSDRWKRMPLAVGGAAVWGAASIVTGLTPLLTVLVGARAVSGMGKIVNEPVHSALIGDFYSPRARAKAFGIHQLANPLGAFVASVTVGFLGEAFGWRLPFLIVSAPTLIVLVLAARVREPERGTFEVAEEDTPPWRETLARLWAVRSLRMTWIGGAFTSGSITALGILLPFFLRDQHGVQPGLRGVLTGIGTAIGAVAVVVGTAFIQRYLDEGPSTGLRRLSWAGASASVALVVVAVSPSLWLSALMVWHVIAVFAFVVPGLRAIVTMVAPPEMRSSAFAIGGMVALAGTGFALIGLAIGSINQRIAFAIMAPIFLRGVLYFFQATKFLDDDVARLDPDKRARAERPDAGERPVILESAGLASHYGDIQVLFGIDVELREGEIVALLGTNGAGKSTLLNAISGLHPPSGGNLWFKGEPIAGEPPERTVTRGIVQVPGGRGVFPGLTVAENLRMGAFTFRGDSPLVNQRLNETYELFPRLDERRGQLAGSLSGGERQMLTLAQSFLIQPKLLMIDELSLGLAPTIVHELLEAVRGINAAGATILVVEQSVNVALTLASRAYFLEKGEVRFSGPTTDLLERDDLLRSVFLEGASAGA